MILLRSFLGVATLASILGCASSATPPLALPPPDAEEPAVAAGAAEFVPPRAEPESALATEDRGRVERIRLALENGDREGAGELLRQTIEALDEPVSGGEAGRIALLLELDSLAEELGSVEDSRRLREAIVALQARTLPPDHPDLLQSKLDLAAARYELGDLEGARELEEEVLAARLRLLPADHLDVLKAKHSLAVTRKALGDIHGALTLQEEVLEARARLLPADHPDLLTAKGNLAMSRKALGDVQGALILEEEALAAMRTLPADDPDLLWMKGNLAETRKALGDFEGALAIEEEVLAARLGLPPDHADLLVAKANLAATRKSLGQLDVALALEKEVLEARARLLPADHVDLLRAKGNLAATLNELGDLHGARALEEEVLAARGRLLPPDHPELLAAKGNHALTLRELGDLHGARALEEEVLEARTRLLGPDHPHLLIAKGNLALTLRELGDLQGARALEEQVLEARARLLGPDHPELLGAKQNLAVTRAELGDIRGARELEEEVLEARARLFGPDHPDLIAAKENLGASRFQLGDLDGARALFEEVLAARLRLLPADHPSLIQAQQNLAAARRDGGDPAGAQELASSLLAGMRARARALRSEAARFAREVAREELERLSEVLSLCGPVDTGSPLDSELLATLESLRLASVASAEAAHALLDHPDLAESAREIGALRARLNDLVAAGAEEESAVPEWRAELLRLAGERDRAERELRGKLAEAGVFVEEVAAPAVAAGLAPHAAAVSFLRYRFVFDEAPATSGRRPGEDRLLAFVVQPGGEVSRVELGSVQELEELVGDWRHALGRPLAGRGLGVGEAAGEAGALEALGRRLRERVLDPVRALASGATTLHVVLDDCLHLVPLDALPLEGGLLGERVAVRNETTLARLVRADRGVGEQGTLTLAGGIDYDAELGGDAPPGLDASAPPLEGSDRSLPGRTGFTYLPGTRAETESIAALHHEVFERAATALTRSGATKAALFTAAPETRFLHLATHGWFAPESFRSQLDTVVEQDARESWQRARDTLVGFAPETLCGLALSGANRGKDVLGRVPGILTAEELASFDLRNCELAVLSACETNVGIRRAGQGIQSLQTALHAAGARTAITSLWKVDDAATRRLFELFYTKLWKEKLGKANALWQAKMALRAEGHPPRDWAGWVLSGDPD